MTHLPLLTYEARPSGHEIVTFGVNITLYNFTGDWANSKKFGTDWIFSFKGKLLFSSPLKILINLVIKIYPFQILIRYIVADAVIRGARSSEIVS